jgi:hypothetical protein
MCTLSDAYKLSKVLVINMEREEQVFIFH